VCHEGEVNKFNVQHTYIEVTLKNFGLLPPYTTNFDTIKKRLLFAFVVRWHKETNNFPLSIGEMIITSHYNSWTVLHIHQFEYDESNKGIGDPRRLTIVWQAYQIVRSSKWMEIQVSCL